MSLASRSLVVLLLVLSTCAAALVAAPGAVAMTSHAGWPEINGMLLMNKNDSDRPLDGRPGFDPFGGEDPTYSCDTIHEDSTCVGQPHKCRFHDTCRKQVTVSERPAHNELLGGHGNDRIHAAGDGAIDTIDCGTGRDRAVVDPTDVVVPGTCEAVVIVTPSV